MNSIKKELAQVGIDSEGGEDESYLPSGKIIDMNDFEQYEIDPDVKAVVVGLDTKFTYEKLSIASLYI